MQVNPGFAGSANNTAAGGVGTVYTPAGSGRSASSRNMGNRSGSGAGKAPHNAAARTVVVGSGSATVVSNPVQAYGTFYGDVDADSADPWKDMVPVLTEHRGPSVEMSRSVSSGDAGSLARRRSVARSTSPTGTGSGDGPGIAAAAATSDTTSPGTGTGGAPRPPSAASVYVVVGSPNASIAHATMDTVVAVSPVDAVAVPARRVSQSASPPAADGGAAVEERCSPCRDDVRLTPVNDKPPLVPAV